MPKVPTYDLPTVAREELPSAYQVAPRDIGRDAAIGARGMMDLGNGVQQAGAEYADLVVKQQADVNEGAVKDAHAQLVSSVSTVLHDPNTGFMNQLGKNAVDGYTNVQDTLSKLPENISAGLENDVQRKMFNQAAAITINSAISQAQQHSGQQTTKYELDSSQARANASADAAVRSYNPIPGADNSLYRQSITTQQIELESQADKLGITGKEKELYVQHGADGKSGMAATYTQLVSHLLDNNQTQAAKDYLNQMSDQLPIAVRDKLSEIIKVGQTKDDALGLAIDLKKHGTIDQQEKSLDDMFKSGKITPEVHEMALQKLRADNSQRRSEQSENDRAIIGQVWDMSHKGQSLADLPTSTLNYIKTRGLGPQVDAIFKRDGEEQNDSKMFSDLSRMSADDPSGFVKMDLSTMSGQLSKSHFNHLIDVQTGINRQDIKAMDANKLVHDTIANTKSSLLAAGINLNVKPGTADADRLDQFETSMRDSLIAAQANKKDAPLTRDEARNIALGILKDQALSGTGYFNDSFGVTHKPAWQMTPDEKAANWKVPDADRTQIIQSLNKNGIKPTEQAIQRAYKMSKGVY